MDTSAGPRTPVSAPQVDRPPTAMLTDHYELTMVEAALEAGTAGRRSVFELFARGLPDGRGYGVVAGTGRLLDAVERFGFDDAALDHLAAHDVVGDRTLAWLRDYRFAGDVWGYPEGELYFPGSPVVVVEGSFAEAVVLETVLLSILNHDSAVASAASRMTLAAGERACIEMGSRRTHEEAAVAAARAAYVAGFTATSNLMAGLRHGVPTAGTSAHSFTLLHDTEREAFTAQVKALGRGTTLLVDTYDVLEAVRLGVEVAGPELGAVRIDSGDLAATARQVRSLLDSLGARDTRIVATSDLDEFAIDALATAPVDGYGVGTAVVTGSGHPACGFVYKLVARADDAGQVVSVAKRSPEKATVGGRKHAVRRLGPDGVAQAEVVGARESTTGQGRDLLVPLVAEGEIVGREPLPEARSRHHAARAELPAAARRMEPGEPVIPTERV